MCMPRPEPPWPNLVVKNGSKTRPQVVGMQELAYGLGFVLMLA